MRLALVFFVLILLGSSVIAQGAITPTNPIQDIWDAIHELEDKVARLGDIVRNAVADINDIFTKISVIESTQDDFQQQINSIPIGIDRTKIYEVFAAANSDTAYCNSAEDILLTGYCSVGPFKESVNVTTAVTDSFSDIEFSTNPTWTVTLGSFVVGTSPAGPLKLVAVGNGLHDIATPSALNSISLSMETKVMPNRTNDQLYIGLTDSPGPILQSNDSGYMLGALKNFNGFDSLVLYRIDQGTFTYLSVIPNIPLPTSVEQSIRAERDNTGYWTVFYNNIPFPTGVQDNTYQSFHFTHLRYNSNNNGGAFDNILVTYGAPGPVESAFENINNPLLPMGIKCGLNGAARITCIDQ